jgi:hypothetical protein
MVLVVVLVDWWWIRQIVERVLIRQARETVRTRARITVGASRLSVGDGRVDGER